MMTGGSSSTINWFVQFISTLVEIVAKVRQALHRTVVSENNGGSESQ